MHTVTLMIYNWTYMFLLSENCGWVPVGTLRITNCYIYYFEHALDTNITITKHKQTVISTVWATHWPKPINHEAVLALGILGPYLQKQKLWCYKHRLHLRRQIQVLKLPITSVVAFEPCTCIAVKGGNSDGIVRSEVERPLHHRLGLERLLDEFLLGLWFSLCLQQEQQPLGHVHGVGAQAAGGVDWCTWTVWIKWTSKLSEWN